MRRVWAGSAAAMLGMLLRAGTARAQASDPIGTLPGWGVVRPPRVGSSTQPYTMPAPTTYGVLDEMASRASVIFVGMVTRVVWVGGDEAPADASAGVVSVEFTVETGVLGVAPGTTYVMKEWAGLWRDAPRYRVGQRRLMLLHAPGPGGLSSPVDGLDGAIPVIGGEPSEQASASGASSPLPALRADLRWIQAKQMRSVAVAGEPGGGGTGEAPAQPLGRTGPSEMAQPLGMAQPRAAGGQHGVVAAGPLPSQANPPLVEVLGRLRAGEGRAYAAR